MKKFSMKKTTAAAVAAAVGAALLLGGAGTLAYWSDTASSSTQIVTAGKLDLGTSSGGTWTVSNGTGITDAAFNTTTGRVVPGDTLKTEFSVPAELVGQNLKSTFTLTPTIPAGTLSSKVTVKVAIASDTATTISATPIVKTFTPTTLATAAPAGNLKVTVTVAFPFDATPTALDNVSMEKVLDAITLNYELKQIANS